MTLGIALGIVLLIFAVFMEALAAHFVYWDDDDLLLLNTAYRTLTWNSLTWMFTTYYAGHFQPLTWLSYWMDFKLWRGDVIGFHLTNVVLHSLTAIVLFDVSSLILRQTRLGRNSSTGAIQAASAIIAVFFACHPLRAESVAWLAERRDVLSGFFYTLTVAFYLRYARAESNSAQASVAFADPTAFPTQNQNRNGTAYYVAAFLACALSALAKASVITLPVVLLILDVFPLRRIGGGADLRRGKTLRVWVEKLPFVALAAVVGLRALSAQAQIGALRSFSDYDWTSRIAQACYGLAFYVYKTIWPANLSPLYQIPSKDVLLGSSLWLAVLSIALVAALAFALRRRWPGFLAALVVYAVILAPVLGLAQSGPQLAADRYSYLSCISLAMLVGYAFLHFGATSWMRRNQNRRAILMCVAAFPLAFFAQRTYEQTKIWTGPIRLWKRAVTHSPTSSIAHVNYGDALFQAGATDEAYAHYNRALELDPNDVVGLHHRGDLHVQLGALDFAIRDYVFALRLDPGRRRAPLSLARLLLFTNRPQDALAVLRDSARRNPDDFVLMRFLAELLATHPDAAVRSGEEALRLARAVVAGEGGFHLPSQVTLASALAENGRFEEAVATVERAMTFARSAESTMFASILEQQLALFREHRPLRVRHSSRPASQSAGEAAAEGK